MNINELRKEINELDSELINILSRRFEVTRKIGIYKKNNNLSSIDANRLNEMIVRLENLAREKSIDPELVKELMFSIHKYVVDEHEQL